MCTQFILWENSQHFILYSNFLCIIIFLCSILIGFVPSFSEFLLKCTKPIMPGMPWQRLFTANYLIILYCVLIRVFHLRHQVITSVSLILLVLVSFFTCLQLQLHLYLIQAFAPLLLLIKSKVNLKKSSAKRSTIRMVPSMNYTCKNNLNSPIKIQLKQPSFESRLYFFFLYRQI